jgi:xanthine dehydrogenase accessory factor
MKDILPEVDAWRTAGNQVAIATVVKVEGRAATGRCIMAVSSAGDLAGSVSGGCVETAVFEEAQEVLRTGHAEADPLRHHRRDGMGRRVGLRRNDRGLRRAGHGMTGLAPSRVEIQTRLEQALAARVPVAVATVVRGGQVGAKLLVLPEETLGGLGDATLDVAVQSDVPDLLARERSETRPYIVVGHDDAVEVFIETFPPPPTLLIFGAVHVAQPLSASPSAWLRCGNFRCPRQTRHTRALPRRRSHHPGLAG